NGSVALRIRDIRLSDKGQYNCFFESRSFFQGTLLELEVAGLGSAPLISVEGYQDGGIRVVCRSAGWYPEPEVIWRDSSGRHLLSLSETKSRGANSLFDTEYSIILQENANQNLSCWIRNFRLNQAKESVIYISDSFFPGVNPWMVSLSVLLPILLGAVAFTLYRLKLESK
uniref:Ig-like domain-containing protein n=1 Tax=Sphenodon punctatus TaxID=8508 RepID=A0A8D0L2Y4_SPHPU